MSLLQIRNLSQRFGGLQALSNVNIELEYGSMTGLIGPNGAGKTTVFNLISGFYQPTGGEILLEGYNTVKLKPHAITALGVARTFQNIRLWPELSVLDNIRLAQHYCLGYNLADALFRTRRYQTREREVEHYARHLLQALDLEQFADERPKNLPYGTQRKVEIARALSVRPKLLLLDEPAAGLNSSDMQELIRLVRWIHKEFDLTVYLIEHHMDVMMGLCDHIKVLDFGTMIAEGSPEQIRNHPAVISAYLGDATL